MYGNNKYVICILILLVDNSALVYELMRSLEDAHEKLEFDERLDIAINVASAL